MAQLLGHYPSSIAKQEQERDKTIKKMVNMCECFSYCWQYHVNQYLRGLKEIVCARKSIPINIAQYHLSE